MTNIYINNRREIIKKAKTDIEMNMILEKIYDDGFEDGFDYCDEKGFLKRIWDRFCKIIGFSKMDGIELD